MIFYRGGSSSHGAPFHCFLSLLHFIVFRKTVVVAGSNRSVALISTRMKVQFPAWRKGKKVRRDHCTMQYKERKRERKKSSRSRTHTPSFTCSSDWGRTPNFIFSFGITRGQIVPDYLYTPRVVSIHFASNVLQRAVVCLTRSFFLNIGRAMKC